MLTKSALLIIWIHMKFQTMSGALMSERLYFKTIPKLQVLGVSYAVHEWMGSGAADHKASKQWEHSNPYEDKPQTPLEETICRNGTRDTCKLSQQTRQYLQKGWLYFHDRLYYISSTEKTWHESKEYCRQQGAELVIINNKEEQDFTRQFNRLTWIGLHDPAKTREWTWVNGDPLITSYWGPGEPNAYENKSENCVEIRDFNWNDESCGNQNFWICEKDVF